MATVVGLDGCKRGWIAAVSVDGALRTIDHHDSARAVLAAYPEAEVFAFDIPIGLSSDSKRVADLAARELLGDQANSVFWAPVSAVLDVKRCAFLSHSEAFAKARQASLTASGGELSISAPSFALLPKIREVGEISADPRIFEAHPEISFAALCGHHSLASKRTWDGLMDRRALLAEVGLRIPDRVGDASSSGTADDIVDAVACAWTAERIASGAARSLPAPPQRIGRREIAIWY